MVVKYSGWEEHEAKKIVLSAIDSEFRYRNDKYGVRYYSVSIDSYPYGAIRHFLVYQEMGLESSEFSYR
jgi:hypothetical protein